LREAAKLIDPTTPQGDILHKAMMMSPRSSASPATIFRRAEVKLLGERAGGVSPANPQAFQKAMQQQAQQKVGPQAAPAPAGV